MKFKRTFLLAIIAIAIILCWRLRNKPPSQVEANQTFSGQIVNSPTVTQLTNNLGSSGSSQNAGASNSYPKQHPAGGWLEKEYSHSISFYGKAVDLDGEPVSAATANFQWATSAGKELSVSEVSDGAGLFSLENERGYKLQVTVSKSDYYTPKSERLSTFAYGDEAGNRGFIANPNSPVIFHLRKKGAGNNLITSQHGMNPNLSFYSPTNGSPVFVDFHTREAGASGQLEIQSWKESKDFTTGQNNWTLSLTIPDGGFVEENDEFPFNAPDGGYQSTIEWQFKDGQAGWQGGINQNFYIKFGSPPVFGRIKINTSAFSRAIFLEYVFNPDGSQNLESDPNQ